MEIRDVFKSKLPEDMSDDELQSYVQEQIALREQFLKPKQSAKAKKAKEPAKKDLSSTVEEQIPSDNK